MKYAAAWANIAYEVLETPYPYGAAHASYGPDDVDVTPDRLHPAFHGSYDWHSSAHMQWSLVRLLTLAPDQVGSRPIEVLDRRLTPDAIAVEAAYLRERPSYERPYGWAWAAMLVAACRKTQWADAVAPLGEVIADLVLAWLPRQAYPVRHGEWLNVVVIAESAPAGDARDWDQSTSITALKQAMGRSCAGLQSLLDAMPAWRAWSLGDRAPMTGPADMAHERVALVGDAAHPMVPYLAQGAGMAIEDAVALPDAMADADAADVPAAFARYAEARWARNAQVQARARRNGEIFHATGPVRLGRDMAMRLLGAKLLDQPWLYGG